MRTWQKSLIGLGLGVVLGPAVLSIPITPTMAQPPSRVEVKEPVATQRTGSPAAGPRRETQVGALPEELEILRFQVEMEGDQLHLAESRLEQAKRWESRARELAPYGGVPMEQLMVAQDGALMRQSDVVAQKAALRAGGAAPPGGATGDLQRATSLIPLGASVGGRGATAGGDGAGGAGPPARGGTRQAARPSDHDQLRPEIRTALNPGGAMIQSHSLDRKAR